MIFKQFTTQGTSDVSAEMLSSGTTQRQRYVSHYRIAQTEMRKIVLAL